MHYSDGSIVKKEREIIKTKPIKGKKNKRKVQPLLRNGTQ